MVSRGDLPLVGNAYGDVRAVSSNGSQYYWSSNIAAGSLDDWKLITGDTNTLTVLDDTPAGYGGSAQFVARVNASEDGVEFVSIDSVEVQYTPLNYDIGTGSSLLDHLEGIDSALIPGVQDVNVVSPDPLPVAQDPTSFDSFGRFRVSTPTTLFDSKQIFDKAPLFWDEAITNVSGNATSVHSTTNAATTMHVESGDTIIRQTYERFNYQPGKSQLILMTGVLGEPVANSVGRIGYFDGLDGIFIERNGTVLRWVIRKNGVDNAVDQVDWSEDPLDGSGASGFDYDPTKAIIFIIDFEWLGVGQVRCGMVIQGKIIYAHHFNHSNLVTSVYMRSPNLTLRYELSSDGATSELVHICSTVMVEGGLEPLGVTRARSVPQRTGLATGVTYAFMGIRLKSTHFGLTIQQLGLSVFSSTNSSLRWRLLIRPTFNGPGFTWTDESNSGLQYAAAVDANTLLDEGTVLDLGYMSAQIRLTVSAIDNALRPGASIAGVPDELWLVVTPITNNVSCQGGLSWRELA